jgi:quinol-cytochrome oxidoreductase complex cytochrome b subunit/cytochrome c553
VTLRGIGEWVDARTGARAARRVLLDEPIPAGTGWLFTLGSVLLALVAVQLLTGACLTLYYAPTPDHAYDSIRFIMTTASGRLVRGLHHFGASFLVVAAALHMLRVIALGSYKPPREMTWLSGLALLGLILAFALTGYLLPWDQRAYWATVVTINISKLTPGAGELIATVLRGGPTIGALTLTRWFAVHVIFLPSLLVGLVVAHLVLMRRQGISGPIRQRTGGPSPFYPFHAARDLTVVAIVLIALVVFAWRGVPPLEAPADPADASYVPRPEWYFLALFQLLKYFPGRLEVIGAIVLPGVLGALLALLPWIDRGPERDPRRRKLVSAAVLIGVVSVVVLTSLGWRDRPVNAAPLGGWSLREIGGGVFVERRQCAHCHSESGAAEPLTSLAVTRGPEWLAGHVADPEVIAPGIRQPPADVHEREVAAIVAYVRRLSRDGKGPALAPEATLPAAVYARHCVGCHKIDGDGGTEGPDLSHIGGKHDVAKLRTWIADPESVDPDAEMPAFRKRLTPEELNAIASYLAARK